MSTLLANGLLSAFPANGAYGPQRPGWLPPMSRTTRQTLSLAAAIALTIAAGGLTAFS